MVKDDNDGHWGMRIRVETRELFALYARQNHRTPAQLVREFMEGYIERQEREKGASPNGDLFETSTPPRKKAKA